MEYITYLYPTESGVTTVEIAVMAMEEQAPVVFRRTIERRVR